MGNGPCDNAVCVLSDCVLIEIFAYLDHKDLIAVSEVCVSWMRVSRDESLWKRRFLLDFHLSFKTTEIAPHVARENSWLNEYIRLVDRVPRIEAQRLEGHQDEVLHVAFSHSGLLFSTCSKDSTVKLWSSGFPCELVHNETCFKKKLRWKYTQFSQFNIDDSLLLVSGVHFGECNSTGEIAVFEVDQDSLVYRCRVLNKPYDLFGCWFNRDWLINGEMHSFSNMHSLLHSFTDIWLCKASQEIQNARTPVLTRLFKFFNRSASTIRMVLTSGYISDWLLQAMEVTEKIDFARKSGNDYDISAEVEKFREDRNQEMTSSSCSGNSSTNEKPPRADDFDNKHRLLIFTLGEKAYTPHEIGFKLVKTDFLEKALNEEVLSDERREMVFKKMREMQDQERLRASGEASSVGNNEVDNPPPMIAPPYVPPPGVDDGDEFSLEFLQSNFDFPDHTIDLRGHVIGAALSPSERFLFVNVRPWPEDSVISDPWTPPPIAQQIDLRVIDLEKMILLEHPVYRGHRGFTPNEECFFVFLDSSDKLIASGSEDKFGYVWDRHYEMLVGQLGHTNVVNSVAFNKKDEEMLVTVSDDRLIKVWRSKHALRRFKE